MVISNEDNPPIKITGIRAFQHAEYIIAYLEANKSYTLTFGDSLAQAPVYDLTYFKDSIGKQIPDGHGIGTREFTPRRAFNDRMPSGKKNKPCDQGKPAHQIHPPPSQRSNTVQQTGHAAL